VLVWHLYTILVADFAAAHACFIRIGLGVFERGENLLQNGIPHIVFRFSQLSEIALES